MKTIQIISALHELQLLYSILEKHYPVLYFQVGIQPEVRALVVANTVYYFVRARDSYGASGL